MPRSTLSAISASTDTGCAYAPKCLSCPWATCVKELPPEERLPFVAALRLVRRYLPAEDRILLPDR